MRIQSSRPVKRSLVLRQSEFVQELQLSSKYKYTSVSILDLMKTKDTESGLVPLFSEYLAKVGISCLHEPRRRCRTTYTTYDDYFIDLWFLRVQKISPVKDSLDFIADLYRLDLLTQDQIITSRGVDGDFVVMSNIPSYTLYFTDFDTSLHDDTVIFDALLNLYSWKEDYLIENHHFVSV